MLKFELELRKVGRQVPGVWNSVGASSPCPSSQFFDTAGLQCVPCLNNSARATPAPGCQRATGRGQRRQRLVSVRPADHHSLSQVPRADGLGCKCPLGWVQRGLDSPYAVSPGAGLVAGARSYSTCLSCLAVGLAPSRDGTLCLPCDAASGATLSPTSGDCVCNSTAAVVVETDATGAPLGRKRCVACPTLATGNWQDTFPDATGTRCVGCAPMTSPANASAFAPMATSQSATPGALTCSCNATLMTAGLNCFLDGNSLVARLPAQLTQAQLPAGLSSAPAAYASTYSQPFFGAGAAGADITLQSPVLGALALTASAKCLAYGSREACNALANACVLQQYDRTNSVACKLYEGLVVLRNPGEAVLEYHTADAPALTEIYWTDTLPWLFYKSAPGDYLGRTDVGLTMSFYSQPAGSGKVSDLPLVLSKFLLNGTWAGFVPLGSQFQLCGAVSSDSQQWRRFGTNYQNTCRLSVSQILAAAAVDGTDPDGNPYFFDLYLQVPGSVSGGGQAWPGRLYPVPVLNLGMRQAGVLVNAGGPGGPGALLTRRFFLADAVTAPKDSVSGLPQAVRLATKLQFSLLAVPDESGTTYPPLLTVGYIDRAAASTSTEAVAFGAAYAMDMSYWEGVFKALLIVSLVGSALLTSYRTLVVSRQRGNQSITESPQLVRLLFEALDCFATGLFVLLAGCALYWFVFFKLQSEVYTMLPLDSTLVAYRKAALGAVVVSSLGVLGRVYLQSTTDVFLLDWEKPRQRPGQAGGPEREVSSWRYIFVANEWNELQTLRVADLDMTLIFAIFMLEGVKLRQLTTVQPAHTLYVADNTEYQATSLLLRFALVAFFMLVPTFLQWVANTLLLQRFGITHEQPLRQLVDLLPVANISILLFDHDLAGYYLHGEAPEQTRDTTLSKLIKAIDDEASGQLGNGRGPVQSAPNAELKKCTVFEVFADRGTRNAYDSLLIKLEEDNQRIGKSAMAGVIGASCPAAPLLQSAIVLLIRAEPTATRRREAGQAG